METKTDSFPPFAAFCIGLGLGMIGTLLWNIDLWGNCGL